MLFLPKTAGSQRSHPCLRSEQAFKCGRQLVRQAMARKRWPLLPGSCSRVSLLHNTPTSSRYTAARDDFDLKLCLHYPRFLAQLETSSLHTRQPWPWRTCAQEFLQRRVDRSLQKFDPETHNQSCRRAKIICCTHLGFGQSEETPDKGQEASPRLPISLAVFLSTNPQRYAPRRNQPSLANWPLWDL